MKSIQLSIILPLIIAFLSTISNLWAWEFNSDDSVHIRIHAPLGLAYDLTPEDDYFIIRPQYIVSYNPNLNAVNYAAWNLNSSWIGKSGRYSGNFITDTSLAEGILRVTHSDYTNSGYDRGHIVRSHERSADVEDNKSTFLMSNIIPQTPDLNRGVWLNFERFCEDLVTKQDKELFIYSGAVYISDSTIGRGVRVPDSCYKIVVVFEKGEGFTNIDKNTKIFSVMMPNVQGIRNHKWTDYAVSVSHIESITGYNFLPDVPKEIQKIIEEIVNIE